MSRIKPKSKRGYRRQHGGAYVLVVMASMFVTAIGLSGLLAERVMWRISEAANDVSNARLYAESGMDIALLKIKQDTNWRQTYTHDAWVPTQNIDRGTFKWKLADDNDTDLNNNTTDPVRVVGWGMMGAVVQKASVRLDANGNGGIGPNLLSNPGFESALSNWSNWACDLTISGNAHNGSQCLLQENRSFNDSDGKQNISGIVQNGTSYYVEVWAKTVSGTETLKIDLKTDGSSSGGQNYQTDSVVVGTNWTKISGVVTPTWSGSLTNAAWRVFSWPEGGTISFYTDDAVLAKILPITMTSVAGTWRREVQ